MTTEALEQTTETELQGDAANQSTDAVETTEQPDAAEADVAEFLESRTKEGQDKEGTEAGKASEEDVLVKEAAEAAAKAASEKAEREARERIAREESERKAKADREAADAKFRKSYDDRMVNVGANLKARLLKDGYDDATAAEIANAVANDFNAHHADGLKLHEPQALETANRSVTQALNEAFKEALGSDAPRFFGTETEPKSYDALTDALRAYREIVTDGLVTKSEAEAETKLALLSYRRSLEEKGLIQGTRSGQSVNGSTGAATFTSEDALHSAWNERQITRDVYAREYQRLTGREL